MGWDVSVLTFGAWQLGGTWGAVSEKEAVATLHHALAQGINMIDTASAYGAGRSETLIGNALKTWDGDAYVATKVLPLGRATGQADLSTIRGLYPARYVRDEVEASLRRLQRDHIDLLQLHLWVEDGLANLEWLEPLLELVVAGKVRRIGVSLPDIRPETGVQLAKTELIHAIQVMFNLFEQTPAENLFPAAGASQTGIIVRVPFDSGALTGTWTPATFDSWATDDKRRAMYRGTRFDETLQRVARVQEDVGSRYPDLAAAALQFCLSEPAVSTVACGMRNRDEVDRNIAALDGPLMDRTLRETLSRHHWPHEFYD